MATPKWFDAQIYMQNKLAQMQATDPDYSWDELYDAFRDAGFVGEEGQYEHFVKFGAAEEVAPNAYFDADEYYAAKAKQYYEEELKQEFTGSEEQIANVKNLIKTAGMNAWTHYQQFGSAEGVDPSNAFDASAYCAAKAEAMNKAGQKAPDGTEWTAEKIADAIADAGMSVLEHYMTYAGTGEGEVEAGATYPVPDDDQMPNPGDTVVIDGSATTYNGTAGDDTFYLKTGVVLQEYDTLDGGEGNDTLVLNDQDQAGTIKNIENLVVRDGNSKTYDLSAFSTSFTLEKAGAAVTVDNVTGQKLVVSSNEAATKLTVNMAAGQTSVDLTSQNRSGEQAFDLSGDSLTSVKLAVDEGENNVKFTDSDAKVTDLAVTATASAAEDDAAKVNVTGLEELTNITVAGAGAVELTVDAAKDALKTVNATDNTGGVAVDLSAAGKAAFTGGAGADTLTVNGSTVAHTLGAGDDTVVVKDIAFALEKGFSVDGGEGTDTLSMLSAVAKADEMTADVFNKTFTNFEELTISDKLGHDLDISGYTGIDHLTLSGANTGKEITMQSGSTLELTKGAEGAGTYDGTLTVSVADAAAGKADVLNIALTGDDAVDGKTITVANVETINVVATDTDGKPDELVVHKLGLTANAATSVTVSGDAKLELTLTGSNKITDINASENTGGLTVDLSSTSKGVTVTGSSAADEITLGAQTVATGGEGKDTFTVTATEMTKYATITDFGAGDKIQLKGANVTAKFGEAISLESTATFEDYVTEAVKGTSAATTNTVSWFQFTDGYTYVVLDTSNDATFSNTDMVVRLQGVSDLEGVQVTNGAFSLPEGA